MPKTITVIFRLHKKNKKILAKWAEEEGLTLGTYIRFKMLNHISEEKKRRGLI